MIQERFDGVKSVITEHNNQIEEINRIDADTVIQSIKLSGGTSPERLRSLSHEDIIAILPAKGGVKPIALAKDIARVLRAGSGTPDTSTTNVSARRAETMSREELLHAYDVNDPTSAVGSRLKRMSREMPFLVLLPGNKVDIKTSLMLLDEIQQNFESRDVIQVDGTMRTTYKVGEKLDSLADENPIYVGRPLRPDGTCDQLQRSWDGVSYEIRALIRLAVMEDELKPTHEAAHQALDLALATDGLAKLKVRYWKAAALYTKKEASNDLPKLRVAVKPFGDSSLLSQGHRVNIKK